MLWVKFSEVQILSVFHFKQVLNNYQGSLITIYYFNHFYHNYGVKHRTGPEVGHTTGSTSPTLFEQWCGFFDFPQEPDK